MGVHSPVSAEDTCKAMSYTHSLQWPAPEIRCTSAPNFNLLSILFATQSPTHRQDQPNCLDTNIVRSTVLVQALHIRKQHSYENEYYKWPDSALSCKLIRLRAW